MALSVTARLEHPFREEAVRHLRAGDMVSIHGRVFTARDLVHRYLYDGGKPPVTLADGAIFHCGPVITGANGKWVLRAAGPTTSARQDAYTPRIIEKHRVRVIIGKGGMGRATADACARFGCVYIQAVGGASRLLASRVVAVRAVHLLDEFGAAEALWELDVQDLPGIVTIDTRGRSMHRAVRTASLRALHKILKDSAPFEG